MLLNMLISPFIQRSPFREVTCALKPTTHVSSRCKSEFTSRNGYLMLLLGESLLSMCQLSDGIFRSSEQIALLLTALTNLFVSLPSSDLNLPTFKQVRFFISPSWYTPCFQSKAFPHIVPLPYYSVSYLFTKLKYQPCCSPSSNSNSSKKGLAEHPNLIWSPLNF